MTHAAALCFFIVLLAAACCLLGQPKPAAPPPPLEEGPVTVSKVNNGTMAESLLYQADRTDQKVALWVPDGVKVVKGIIFHLHRASEAYRTDFQEFARAHDFAVYASLIRWTNFEKVLPAQLERLGRHIGHPEVANVPWAAIGGSRNVGALTNYMMLDPNKDRILCMLWSGGPGVGIDANSAAQLEMFRKVPVMTVNGSADPFVNFMAWQHHNYPRVRKLNLPWACAVDWNCGHGPEEGNIMNWPFVEAVIKVRYPPDADPTKGPIRLRPFTYEQGWLMGPVDWDNGLAPDAAPVPEYKGDPVKATWMPDSNCVAAWRAFVGAKEPATKVVAESLLDGGKVKLSVAGGQIDPKGIRFMDGQQEIGKADASPFTLTTDALATGCHIVHAVVTLADGKQMPLQPIVVINGKHVDQRAGLRAAAEADLPLFLIQLTPQQKDTLRTLMARKNSLAPADWKAVFTDDFATGLKPVWYEYYSVGKAPGGQPNRMEAVDGTMQLSGAKQAVAMLPWDWPDDVAVEYRAKSVSDAICDLSVVLSGNPGGSAFPWRGGMMFQFGGHMNEGTHFLILEEPNREWKRIDTGDRVQVGKWHTVRVERLAGVCRAWIDGKLVADQKLPADAFERFFGRRIGLYTFGSTAQFDDVKVFVRQFRDPAAVQPSMPPDSALDDLAASLARLMAHRHGEQRGAANRLAQDFSWELAGSFKRLLAKNGIEDAKVKQSIERRLEALRPE